MLQALNKFEIRSISVGFFTIIFGKKRDFFTFNTPQQTKVLRRLNIILIGLFFCTQTKAQIDFGGSIGTANNANNPVTNNSNTFVPKYNNESINQVISVVHQVEETQNFINLGNLSPDSNVALPFGIIKDIGAVRYVIAIDSLKFKPNGAFFSAYAAIDFPGTSKKIAFTGKNIMFNPSGVIGHIQHWSIFWHCRF